jgi:predicted cation transporter
LSVPPVRVLQGMGFVIGILIVLLLVGLVLYVVRRA